MTRYKIHPSANSFPMMTDDEYKGLRADIAENGQREEIAIWRGLLVDGRNRLKACDELGKTPIVKHLDDDADPWAYVVSHNLHRRHLTTSQRAMVAASLATSQNGTNQHTKTGGQICPPTIEAAAKSLKVSPRSVKAAKQVQKHGSDEIKAAVTNGTLPVSTAARLVLKKPPKKPQPPASDESASQIREVVKAFTKLENRMSALKKMLKSLEHHELCILKDWIDDHQEQQGKAKQ